MIIYITSSCSCWIYSSTIRKNSYFLNKIFSLFILQIDSFLLLFWLFALLSSLLFVLFFVCFNLWLSTTNISIPLIIIPHPTKLWNFYTYICIVFPFDVIYAITLLNLYTDVKTMISYPSYVKFKLHDPHIYHWIIHVVI